MKTKWTRILDFYLRENKMKKIGFYGGCFNPPTKAHIEMAKKAIKECDLDEVVFVPVGDSYKKQELAQGIDRYNMLKIACEGNDKLKVSDIEIRSSHKYNAIDIFEIISNKYKDDNRFFLMGVDNLSKMSEWKESKKLIENYNYIIFERNNIDANLIIENNEMLENNKENFEIIKNNDYKEISSTNIRESIKIGKKPEDINEKVYKYIIDNKIYDI